MRPKRGNTGKLQAQAGGKTAMWSAHRAGAAPVATEAGEIIGSTEQAKPLPAQEGGKKVALHFRLVDDH